MSKSTETGSFTCASCGVDYNPADELANHAKQVHEVKKPENEASAA